VINVVRNDRSTACHFIAYELWRDFIWYGSSERFAFQPAVTVVFDQTLFQLLEPNVFANGDVLHFRSNDALACIMHLGYIGTGLGTTRLAHEPFRLIVDVSQRLYKLAAVDATVVELSVATAFNPSITYGRKSGININVDAWVSVRSGCVVEQERFVVGERNLPHRHLYLWVHLAGRVDLLRAGEWISRNCQLLLFDNCAHCLPSEIHAVCAGN
jgi:hypothetical protein